MGIGKQMAYNEGYNQGFRDAIMKDKYKGEKFANCENINGRISE